MNNKPMLSRKLNLIENVNEVAVYLSCYFMFIFTDWIPDIETRNTLGWFYLPMFLFIVSTNLAYVFYEMFLVTIKSRAFGKCRYSVLS